MKRKYKARKTIQIHRHVNDHYMKNMKNTIGSMLTSCNTHPDKMQPYGVFDNAEARSVGIVFGLQDLRKLRHKLDDYGLMIVKEAVVTMHGKINDLNKHHKVLIVSLRIPEKQDEV